MALYRRAFTALDATAVFRKQFNFSFDNQRKLQCMIHPNDEKNLDSLEAYSFRDSLDTFRELFVNILRGILVYVLKEEDNIKENLKHLNR